MCILSYQMSRSSSKVVVNFEFEREESLQRVKKVLTILCVKVVSVWRKRPQETGSSSHHNFAAEMREHVIIIELTCRSEVASEAYAVLKCSLGHDEKKKNCAKE